MLKMCKLQQLVPAFQLELFEKRLKFLDKKLSANHIFKAASCTKELQPHIVQRYHDKPWRWSELSKNPNITIDFVLAYLNKPWDWFELSKNIRIDVVAKNPNLPWSWIGLSCNSTITIQFLIAHMNKPWNWCKVSSNPNITMEYVLAYPSYHGTGMNSAPIQILQWILCEHIPQNAGIVWPFMLIKIYL